MHTLTCKACCITMLAVCHLLAAVLHTKQNWSWHVEKTWKPYAARCDNRNALYSLKVAPRPSVLKSVLMLNGQECQEAVALPETRTFCHTHLLAEGRHRSWKYEVCIYALSQTRQKLKGQIAWEKIEIRRLLSASTGWCWSQVSIIIMMSASAERALTWW